MERELLELRHDVLRLKTVIQVLVDAARALAGKEPVDVSAVLDERKYRLH